LKCCETNQLVSYNDANLSDALGGYYCSAGNICPSGTSLCPDNSCKSSCDGGKCAWYNIPCKIKQLFATIGLLLTIFKWILLVIASFVALIFGRNISEKYLIKKRKEIWIAWTLGILLALGVGIVCYILLLTWIFYAIAFGVILFFVLSRFVPAFAVLRKLGG
jgi:hypothetical protein